MENITEGVKTSNASDILKERKRNISYKLRISDIHRGSMMINEKFSYLELDGREVSRVNLIANVIDKFVSEGEKRYASLTIDDASSQIRVKAFGEDTERLKEFEIGDTVLVIGSLRHFNNEIYVLPEIMRHLSTEWLLARKLELEKIYSKIEYGTRQVNSNSSGIPAQSRQANLNYEQKKIVNSLAFNKPEVSIEKIEDSGLKQESKAIEESKQEPRTRDKIIEILRKNSEGINIDEIILSLSVPVEEINKTVTEMLEQAEIYEPKPGRIRLL